MATTLALVPVCPDGIDIYTQCQTCDYRSFDQYMNMLTQPEFEPARCDCGGVPEDYRYWECAVHGGW